MDDITKRADQLHEQIKNALQNAKTEHELEQVRLQYLTRNAELAQLLASLKDLNPEQKRVLGPQLNQMRDQVYALYDERKKQVQQVQYTHAQKKQELFDVTAYQPGGLKGSLHPYSIITQKIEDIFISMGYAIADGTELEDEWHNFDALNIPPEHPARDLQDTLWLELPQKLMRTHTSNVQIRTMQNNKPPLAILSTGRVFRYEATDATHDYAFMQTEGFLVDTNTSMAQLLATMKVLLQAIFEREDISMSVRPTYYPFVEPGIEVHMSCVFCTKGCNVCKNTRYIEVVGAGMVHPNVLTACGIDPKIYNGFAFGFGLTRLVQLKYGINDVRLLTGGNLEFLTQF
jgi:phenylalanyl-tRNA synthetase alpha chain